MNSVGPRPAGGQPHEVLQVAIIVLAIAVIFAVMAALKSVMQMHDPVEPGRLTVVGFLALMVVLTLVWIGFIAWAA